MHPWARLASSILALTTALALVVGGLGLGGRTPAPAAEAAALPPVELLPQLMARQTGGTLTVGMESDVVTLDPPMFTDVYSSYVSQQIHETLMTTDFNARIVPLLAEYVENPDSQTYIFKLREGVRFHNGEEMTADDVVFSWRRVMDPATKSPRQARFTDAIESPDKITALNKYTVKVELKAPFAPFLDRTVEGSFSILSQKAVEAAGANYAQRPVGTGPFKFVEWRTGDRAIVERNDNYWGQKANLDRIIFRPIPESNTRLIELESGGIDHLMGIPPAEVDRLKQEPRLQVQIEPAINIGYLAMHTQKEPFKDNVKLRQAIAYAIDRDEILQTIFYGLGLPAITPLNPSNWAHNPNVERYDFNPSRAKQLFQESGYSGGSLELSFNDTTETRQQGERIQAQLKEVLGLDITLKPMEWGGFLSYLREGNHQMFLLGWSGGSDPDGILYPLFHSKNWGAGGNRAFYKNDEVDELLAKAQVTLDQEQRKQMYMKAQEIIMSEAPWKTLRHGIQSAGLRSYVQGFKIHPLGRQIFGDVTISR